MDIKLSIIIPTFNRIKTLETTLRTISELDIDFSLMEVVVVDNGSTDETRKCCEKFQNDNETINFNYLYDAEPGLLTGRHCGAAHARGEILSFIDDDVELSVLWAKSILDIMQNRPEVMLLTGPNLPKYE